MNEERERAEAPPHEHPDAPEGGWPRGMPYTVYFPEEGGYRGGDLEHAAPLPRVGDTVEYIDERGACRRYRVREVVHTLQTAADRRPPVHDARVTPVSTPRAGEPEPEPPGGSGALRAGLPKVFLDPEGGGGDAG